MATSSGSARAAGSPERPRSSALIILILAIPPIAATFESSMVLAAIPRLMEVFDADAAAVGWVATAYLLSAAAVVAVAGRLGDIYGYKRVLIVVLAISIIGSLISMGADSLLLVTIGRVVQGTAAAAVPLCLGAARSLLPASRVPLAVALITGSLLLFAGVALLVGGMLVDSGSWRVIFATAAAMLLVGLLVVIIGLPSFPGMAHRPRIDWIGGLALVPGIAAVLLGATQGRTWGWDDPRVLTAIGLGLLTLAGWAWWELRVPEPMVNLRMFANRKVMLAALATIAMAIPLSAPKLLYPLTLQGPPSTPFGLGLSATDAGVLLFSASVVGFLGAPISGRISAAVGARSSLMIAAGLGVVTYIGWIFLPQAVVATAIVVIAIFVLGTFTAAALPTLIVEAVPKENTGEGTAAILVVQNVFSSVGVAVASMILAASTVPGAQQPSEAAFVACLLFAAVMAAIALVLASLIRRTHRSSEVERPTPSHGGSCPR